jgi:outer membrane receptor protein involved in Fe transport
MATHVDLIQEVETVNRVNNTKLQLAVAQVLAGSMAIGVAVPSYAADLEEVTVTGTRILKPNETSNSPITTITAQALEQLNTVNLESELRKMPQFLPGSTEFINNGNPGAATINLRGLGSNRTLVLMDGKRLPPFGTSGAVDINLIPTAMIERVDIVTGGASAVYGSDAVAGVVNFITKSNFEGIQIDANTAMYGNNGDGSTNSVSVTAGGLFADDRGSAVISVGYTERDPVLQGDRKYSNYFLNAVDGYRYNGYWYQYASSITDPSRRGGSSNAGATRARVRNATGGFSTRYFTPDGRFTSAAGLGEYAPNSNFNYNPYNYFQVPQERWQAMAKLSFKLSDYAEVYGSVFAVNSQVNTQLAPSAFFGGSTATFKVNLDNPFLSTAQRTALITAYNNEAAFPIAGENAHGVYDAAATPGTQLVTVTGIRRRLPELGPRIGINEAKTMQFTLGVRGDLGASDWTYDAWGQYGRVSTLSGLKNDVSIERARASIIAIDGPNGPVCAGGSAGCAPVNIFTGNGAVNPSTGIPMTGTISQEAADYIRASYYSSQVNEVFSLGASTSGKVAAAQLPWADSPLSLAFGVEYSESSVDYQPDDLTRLGGAMGQGGTSPPLKGSINNREVFGELYLPIATGKTGVDNLALEAGVRFTDNNLAGSFETWKVGLEWQPVAGYRIRGMVQRAVRAPNIGEQFAPKSFGLTEVRGDPCSGTAPLTDAALAAICLAQGAPPESLGGITAPAAQQAANIGGGARALGVKLAPEEADTYTIGFQINPGALPGFSASVDYYNIEIDGGIGSYGAQEILDNCFVNNISSFCSLVKRNNVGELEGDGFGIVQETRNLATIKAEGIDYSVGYNFDLSAVDISLGLFGTHVLESSFKSSPTSPTIKCAGLYGDTCGEPTPEDRINFSASVDWNMWTFAAFVRYLSAVDVQARADDPDQTGRSIYLIEKIDSYTYLDLSAQLRINDNVKLTFAAQNVLDKDPTIVGNIPGSNTSMNVYADTYDPLGPRYSLGVSVKF